MANNLPAILVLEKNKLSTTSAWIVLFEIMIDETTTINICQNNEEITFEGKQWLPFPCKLDAVTANSQGEIPSIKLRITNVSRVLQPYIEAYTGGTGAEVRIIVVNSAALDDSNNIALELFFDVLSSSADSKWLTLDLGTPNPLRRRYPLYRAIARHCNWTFKSRECNYTGADTTCKRHLEDCRLKNNSDRFGGRPGLDGQVRLA